VSIKSEFVTAGDDRVCSQCEALEAQIFTIEEAQGIIPVHPSCFPRGVIITTDKGLFPIEDVNINDFVLTRLGYQRVVKTMKRPWTGNLITIFFNKIHWLSCTSDHPIFDSKTRKFREAQTFIAGDEIKIGFNSGIPVLIESVEEELITKPINVYNLTIENKEEYYANNVLVHNCRCAWIPTSPT
jgi:intein/homing endonuclease